MKKIVSFASILLLAASCRFGGPTVGRGPDVVPNPAPAPEPFDGRLEVTSPKPGEYVDPSGFTVSGRAQGWFEGNVPVYAYDDAGNEVGFAPNTVPDSYERPGDFNVSVQLTTPPDTAGGSVEFFDYSAKDGSLVYHRTVPVKFSERSGTGPDDHTMPTFSAEGFSFSVPSNLKIFTAETMDESRQLSYIPPCQDGALACAAFAGKDLQPGTNLGGGGFSVRTVPAASESACKSAAGSAPNADGAPLEGNIDGQRYWVTSGGGAAAGHSESATSYVTWHGNTCWQLSLSLGQTNVGNYEPGSIKEFDVPAARRPLERTLVSFRFKG